MSRRVARPLVALALLLAAPIGLYAATGGPDAQGYVFTDSDEADGPPVGTITLQDPTEPGLADDGTTVVPIGFDFEWYGFDYDEEACREVTKDGDEYWRRNISL